MSHHYFDGFPYDVIAHVVFNVILIGIEALLLLFELQFKPLLEFSILTLQVSILSVVTPECMLYCFS